MVKNPPAMQELQEMQVPPSGRCPGEGNGNPLQYSCLSYTLKIMSKTLQVSSHSYRGCDVTNVVYVLSYTVGSVFRNIIDVMS